MSNIEEAKRKISKAIENNDTVLDLNSMNLNFIPKEIGNCSNLRILRILKNNITDIPKEIGKLKRLEVLWLSGNKITLLPEEVGELINLKELFLTGNRLEKIPIELTYLKRLRNLNLRSNRLVELPFEFSNMKLDKCQLNDNPLISPPIEIATRGMKAISNYFDSMSDTKEVFHLKEAKLLLVGEGGVGKTCVMKKLIDRSYIIPENETTTEGIDIENWSLVCENESEVKVNIWDFGGQEIYHSTHQFFLTKRSIYIYIWNARTDDDLSSRFEYWLNTIKLLSDDSPLIIVQNKVDERMKLIDEESLKKVYPNIVGFINLSAKTGEGFDELIFNIKYQLSRLPHLGDRLPKEWIDIRKDLESLTDNYIGYSKYLEICKNKTLAIEKSNFLSKYFHDLGVFLHFGDNSILRKTLFLKPQWATNAVYKIMDTKAIQSNKGRFNFNDLQHVWKGYPEDRYFHLLELMKRFELCFQIPNSNDYIVPNLLPPSKPKYSWNSKYNLKFEYHYDFMPAGILSRFIVRVHDIIRDEIYWKNGVVIKRESIEAEIIAYPFEKKIKIRLKGSNKKDLLSIIRREIDHIHKSQNEPNVNEMIPCNCAECKASENPNFHSYQMLLKAFYKGKETIECNSSFGRVDVRKLLGEVGAITTKFQGRTINVYGDYYEKSNDMKIRIGNINGGNQQFADLIINSPEHKLSSGDAPLLGYINENAETDQEKIELVDSLDIIKDPEVSSETKKTALEMLKNFFNSGAKEAGKRVVAEVAENGNEYLEPLQQLLSS